jgi:hypothetical protein
VCLSFLDHDVRNPLLVTAIQNASRNYGFTFVVRESSEEITTKGFAVSHLILCSSRSFAQHVVDRAERELQQFGSVSLAFTYGSKKDAERYAAKIEKIKNAAGDRLNFLRPDEHLADLSRVSLQKVVDNAVCDSVRVKYSARQVDAYPAWDTLHDKTQKFFFDASRLYRELRLFHRSGWDGYFAARTPDGFAITCTKSNKSELDVTRISLVLHYNDSQNVVTYKGRYLPSSDTVEAACIFAACSNINAIVHTHASDRFTRNPFYASHVLIPKMPYGEFALGRALADVVGRGEQFVIMEEHGEVFAGAGGDEVLSNITSRCLESGRLSGIAAR